MPKNEGKPSMSAVREDGVWAGRKDDTYSYVLRYIEEAIDARGPLIEHANRAIHAYQGNPSRDKYLSKFNSYITTFIGEDNERADKLREICKEVPARQNFTIMSAIDTMVSQAMGGIAQYECEPYDPHFYKDPAIVDKLRAAAKYAYIDNNVDAMIPVGIETAGLTGGAYTFIEKKDNSDKVLDLTWIPMTEMLLDPVRLKRNRERYIGHQTTKSWNELRQHLKKSAKFDEYVLESINEVDTYLSEVEFWVNKHNGNFDGIMKDGGSEHIRRDLDKFYKGSALAWVERNSKYSKHGHVSTDGDDDDRYIADDVEVSYLFDLSEKIMFTVVNRRFIVKADKDYMSASIDYMHPVVDPFSGNVTEAANSVRIQLDHPYAPIEFKRSTWMNYAYSPIIHVLDTFDDICALESLIYHTISIMTPITFTGNPTDIEKLSQIAGISGETIKGFIANSVTVLNKVVDLTPALSELQRLESKLKWILHGPDAAEQANIIGDRASGTEATMSSAMVTQGLNPLLANVEAWASTLASKMFKFLIIYNNKDWEYRFPMDLKVATLSREELAGEMQFRAVLKNRIKIEARQHAQMTVQWYLPLVQSDIIPNKEAMTQDVVPVLAENFSRRQIEQWFKKSEQQEAMERAQLESLHQQEQAAKAQVQQANGIDMSQVNPYGTKGQLSGADIGQALSPDSYDMSSEDPEAGDGGRKPSPTSRKLQYGITPKPAGEVVPIPTLTSPDVETPYSPPEFAEPTLVDALFGGEAGVNDPEVSGIAANDPLANM